jgi:hypothetical protein
MTQMTVCPISLPVDQINSAGKKFGISVIVVISVIANLFITTAASAILAS